MGMASWSCTGSTCEFSCSLISYSLTNADKSSYPMTDMFYFIEMKGKKRNWDVGMKEARMRAGEIWLAVFSVLICPGTWGFFCH